MESSIDDDSEKHFKENPDEVQKYAAYTDFSSFRKYTAKLTPSLFFYPIQNIEHSAKPSRRRSSISIFQKRSVWILSAACGFVFALFVSGFYHTTNSFNLVDKRIQLTESDCSFHLKTNPLWKIEEQDKRCSVKFSSPYGSISIFVFPNTSLSLTSVGSEHSDLIVELQKGKIYLKENLSKPKGTKFKIAAWNVQLTGTVVFSEVQNKKLYFTLIEGSVESQYIALNFTSEKPKDLLLPGDTIELEENSHKYRKVRLETKPLDRLQQDLNHWNEKNKPYYETNSAYFFNRTKKIQNGMFWVVRLKDGRILKGRIQSEEGRVVIFTQSGKNIFNEDEILSISK
ncbi:hypothetical protein [Leptospira tipperaryensis]|uniref:hypothetical protein n=1 Tax=Leptospira tipperaryensis TaxID=2564040 RepID=UPI0012EACF71|nr:hypothetical protein [Leptospira tipperaryensis]